MKNNLTAEQMFDRVTRPFAQNPLPLLSHLYLVCEYCFVICINIYFSVDPPHKYTIINVHMLIYRGKSVTCAHAEIRVTFCSVVPPF